MFAAPRPPARGPKPYKGKVTDMNRLLATLLALALTLALLAGCAAPATPASIVDAKIDENGNLILFMSSGTTINAGEVRGEDGVSVAGAIVDGEGNLQISLSDDTVIHAGHVRGADGQDGADGRDGADGQDGRDGRDGVDGKDGRDGIDGKDGADGRDGTDGRDGANGKDGADGLNGQDGKDGQDGQDGQDGEDGKDGLTPYIGANGNWWLGDADTGVRADHDVLTGNSYNFRFASIDQSGRLEQQDVRTDEADIAVDFNYETAEFISVGGESKKMGLLTISGFPVEEFSSIDAIFVDKEEFPGTTDYGSVLAPYLENAKDKLLKEGVLNLPMELLKAKHTTHTFWIQAVGKSREEGTTLEVILRLTVDLHNIAVYKDVQSLKLLKIWSETKGVDVYCVGSTLYFDFAQEEPDIGEVLIRAVFGDGEGQEFTETTWMYGEEGYKPMGDKWQNYDAVKLEDSEIPITFSLEALQKEPTVTFTLEDADNLYEGEYKIRYRDGIKERDPMGIYFAEGSKTISVGETYKPVVLGVATGRVVEATLQIGEGSDNGVIRLDGKGNVVGVQPGVTYISAKYPSSNGQEYAASSMKITVTGA